MSPPIATAPAATRATAVAATDMLGSVLKPKQREATTHEPKKVRQDCQSCRGGCRNQRARHRTVGTHAEMAPYHLFPEDPRYALRRLRAAGQDGWRSFGPKIPDQYLWTRRNRALVPGARCGGQ